MVALSGGRLEACDGQAGREQRAVAHLQDFETSSSLIRSLMSPSFWAIRCTHECGKSLKLCCSVTGSVWWKRGCTMTALQGGLDEAAGGPFN
jgi:hypothetical protein